MGGHQEHFLAFSDIALLHSLAGRENPANTVTLPCALLGSPGFFHTWQAMVFATPSAGARLFARELAVTLQTTGAQLLAGH